MLQKLLCYLVNSVCCFLYHKEYNRFISINDIEKVQNKKLLDILSKNIECKYGRRYNFESIKTALDFQSKVPITTYEDYIEYIEEIKDGKNNILTTEDILLLEPTSGSTSASKLIPYTKSLKEEFQKGLKPWIYNLYSGYKGIKRGRSYWSVTPAASQTKYTKGGIPIGFEEDSEYFGRLEKKLLEIILAVPKDAVKEKDIDAFYYKTVLHLLKCKDLTLISVWNPTLLILFLEYIEKNSGKLVSDISMISSKKRAAEVRRILEEKVYHKLWKNLKVISCWCDASAEVYSDKIKALFPGVTIQPKGLLATEGFVSFPFAGESGARLSLSSHFFEFISTSDNKIYLAHELKKGKEYAVIITTSGGLYRYKLNDLIEVTGFSGVFPLVRFKGKQDRVSDLFGEKLNELFIKNVIEKSGIKPDFYMFAPETDRYVLYIKAASILDTFPSDIDGALRENFHYDYCRKLRQLKELRLFKLTGNPGREYLDECVRRGQRLGDIKQTALHLQGNWDKVFKGEYL